MRPAFLVRQLSWDLATNLLVRPFLLIVVFGALGEVGPLIEENTRIHELLGPLPGMLATEPGSAQVVLGTLAGSMMTVVSVVYSILVVALSLASVQFSTRILVGFVRDASSQWVLGLLLGAFTYCLVVLRAVRVDPPFVPVLSVGFAVLLALTAVSALVWFIDHIASSIQANHIVDRIAAGAEAVIDDVYLAQAAPEEPLAAFDGAPIYATRTGYVQLIDLDALARVASAGKDLRLERGMGKFVAEGALLARCHPPATAEEADAVRAAFDLGVSRTMQQDVEWGLRQIVDIGLKAISPAVNDPSTGATCIDHLTRLLLRAARRHAPPLARRSGSGRLVVPTPRHADLVDLAYEQLRQYGKADMAIAIRLARSMQEVAEASADPAVRTRIAHHARLLEVAVRAGFPAEDCEEFDRRRVAIAAACGAASQVA